MKTALSLLIVGLSLILSMGVRLPVQVVHENLESVHGSAVDMGCTGPLTVTNGVTTCGFRGNGAISYLIDGISPTINTSTSDWASQLVTVEIIRRSQRICRPDIPFPHVLLTFGFDTAVSLTRIEVDMFICADWKIGTPSIAVHVNQDYNLVFTSSLPYLFGDHTISSCDSLSTVNISGDLLTPDMSYQTFHIMFFPRRPMVEWIYVGEVTFVDSSGSRIVFADTTLVSTDVKVAKSTGVQLEPTSVPGDIESDSTCSEESSGSAAIAVSAVSLLLILTLTTVILTQCLLIFRMRRSRNKTETYAEATNPTTKTTDVPVSPNEAYALTKIREEVTYEVPNADP